MFVRCLFDTYAVSETGACGLDMESLYAWRIFYDPGTFRWNVSLFVPVYSVAEICSNTEKNSLSLKKQFDYQKRVSQMRYSFCLSLSILAILLLQKHITALHESAGTPALLYQSDFALQFLCIERSPVWLFLAVSGKRHRFREHCKSSLHVLCSRKMPALVSDIAWQEQQPR